MDFKWLIYVVEIDEEFIFKCLHFKRLSNKLMSILNRKSNYFVTQELPLLIHGGNKLTTESKERESFLSFKPQGFI